MDMVSCPAGKTVQINLQLHDADSVLASCLKRRQIGLYQNRTLFLFFLVAFYNFLFRKLGFLILVMIGVFA